MPLFEPHVVVCNWEKVAKHGLEGEKRSLALSHLKRDGFIILRSAINPARIATLQEKMFEDLTTILSSKEELPEQFIAMHIQHNPPPTPPYLFTDIMCNEAVIDICSQVLGKGMKNNFYSGNTNLSGSTDQPVHIDTPLLWQHLEHPYPASSYIINIPMVDCDSSSGSVELWPGSHLNIDPRLPSDGSIVICEELLEEQRDISAPIQPQLQVGDCLIRDERLWHAGKGHNSGVNRPMIALIYSCPWRQWEGLQLEKSAEKLLVHEHLTQNAHFFSGDHDYLFCNSSYIEK